MGKDNYSFSYRIKQKDRLKKNNHKPILIWFFGHSGSGKSTLASKVEEILYKKNINTFILDGDNVRKGLNSDLGFEKKDRIENLRRISEISKLLIDNGLVVLSSFITPYQSERDKISKSVGNENIFWVLVDTPLEICKARDPKKLYEKALKGEISNFTGVSSKFEKPSYFDFKTNHSDSVDFSSKKIAEIILKKISI